MTVNWVLNWAGMAVSICNAILLIWLGLTVLLNAERRTWGLWLAGGEILLGGIFFLIHTIILGHGIDAIWLGMDFWWHLGWMPVVAIPYIWYLVVLWYAGFWEAPNANLHRRHMPLFIGVTMMAVLAIGLLAFANPLPSISQVARLEMTAAVNVGGIPLLILIYPLYILSCILLSVDALQRPAPSGRIMGDQARRRARPWLVAAAITQIPVSLLVGGAMLWVTRQSSQPIGQQSLTTNLALFDLAIAALIALAVIFLGQAITSYEVFTGKALPRFGLFRYWQRAILLAGGFSATASLILARNLHPIYSIVLSALLITLFFALLSWRIFSERQGFISLLRPFVISQRVYEQVLADRPTLSHIDLPFTSLCRDVLGTRQAYLAAIGPQAPLIGDPVFYPEEETFKIPDVKPLLSNITPDVISIPLPEDFPGDWLWIAPLWSERGLSGFMLLGEKTSGSLYAQEEIEIARTIAERLIDMRASAEIARRLVFLQRQRLAESQVADRRLRRVLHDDVIPHLHAALLSVNTSQNVDPGAIEALTKAHHQIADLLRELPSLTTPDLLSQGLIRTLDKTIKNELPNEFDHVVWDITDEASLQLNALTPLKLEVIYFAAREAIRNAARYGGAAGLLPRLSIAISNNGNELEVSIEDTCDGKKEESPQNFGSGQGLALHSTMMAVIGGALSFEQTKGGPTRITLRVPLQI